MKSIKSLLFIAACLVTSAAFSQVSADKIMQEVSKGRPYILGFLKKGNTPEPADSTVATAMQMEHLQYLFGLREQGKLSIFGPVLNSPDLIGIMIFNSQSMDEVKKWLNEEPFVKKGMLRYELFNWFGLPGASLPK